MTPFGSDKQRKAAFARKQAPSSPTRKATLASAKSRRTAADLEVQAQVDYDAWLINELRRRDPETFRGIASGYVFAHTSFVGKDPTKWSMDEAEDTAALVKDVETALYARANNLPDPIRSRLLTDLHDREALMQHKKRILHMRPERLRRELDALQRSFNWTSPSFVRERLQRKRLLNATKRELERRGLEPKDPKESG